MESEASWGIQRREAKASDPKGFSVPGGKPFQGSLVLVPGHRCVFMLGFHNLFSWKPFLKSNSMAINTVSVFKELSWTFLALPPRSHCVLEGGGRDWRGWRRAGSWEQTNQTWTQSEVFTCLRLLPGIEMSHTLLVWEVRTWLFSARNSQTSAECNEGGRGTRRKPCLLWCG